MNLPEWDDASAIVIEDDDFTRTLVSNLIESIGLTVRGSASNVTDGMKLAVNTKPDLAVVDLDLGQGPTGIDLAHGLRKHNPRIAIIFLTSYAHPRWAGIRKEPPVGSRWIIKSEVNDLEIVRSAISQALANPLIEDETISRDSSLALSDSQIEILRLVAAGHTNGEIAKRRSLTEDAVNKAVSRLVKQLHLPVSDSSNTRVMLTRAYNQHVRSVSDRRD